MVLIENWLELQILSPILNSRNLKGKPNQSVLNQAFQMILMHLKDCVIEYRLCLKSSEDVFVVLPMYNEGNPESKKCK